MKGIFLRKRSPYYWLRYYDALEPDPKRKRKEHNTKIKVTAADIKRLEQKKPGQPLRIQGTPQLWQKVKELKLALADRKFESDTNSKIKRKLKLSEGYADFRYARTIPGSKGELKNKTLLSYSLAVDHMIKACTDKYIYQYNKNDYNALLYYFEDLKLSMNSRAIYTRSLKAIWNYFVKNNLAEVNIIESLRGEDIDPKAIPNLEMSLIIRFLKDDDNFPQHYWFIYFLLLTGCRPSSAIVQMKEDIDFKKKIIKIQNVKTGKRKGRMFYKFPLYSELEKLLREMGVKEGDTGRLFDMFAVNEDDYTSPLSFWKRKIELLYKAKAISAKYSLKQIRKTFISFLINDLEIDAFQVQKLADHSDLKVTEKSYIDFKLSKLRKTLDDFNLDSLREI